MTNYNWEAISEYTKKNGFVEDTVFKENLQIIMQKLNITKFSKYYLDFLQWCGGCNIKDEIPLYNTKEILIANVDYKISFYAPGYFAICNDSENKLILMKCNGDDEIFTLQFFHGLEYIESVSKNLYEWIKNSCPISNKVIPEPKNDLLTKVDVLLIKKPIDGPKFLLLIKKELGLEISIKDMNEGLRNLPYLLISNECLGECSRKCEKINLIEECLQIVDHDNPQIKYPWRYNEL